MLTLKCKHYITDSAKAEIRSVGEKKGEGRGNPYRKGNWFHWERVLKGRIMEVVVGIELFGRGSELNMSLCFLITLKTKLWVRSYKIDRWKNLFCITTYTHKRTEEVWNLKVWKCIWKTNCHTRGVEGKRWANGSCICLEFELWWDPSSLYRPVSKCGGSF